MAVQEACARAPYAADATASRGRLLHSTAFRRLAHKTQVFVYHEGDHFRTRLTHTLEVTQVARSIARALGLDEDLAEACALAHDLGHPPFGHAGERALDRCLAAHGGFDHNAQTLAVVTRLERRYPAFDGLNLTWETLEGLVKHNGPLIRRIGGRASCDAAQNLAPAIRDYDALHNLDLWSFPSLEAQVGAIADDIAYDAHDMDDGLRAGLFSLDDLAQIEIAAHILQDVVAEHKEIDPPRLVHELIRRIITAMIGDVVAETRRLVALQQPTSVADVRAAESPLVAFSPSMAAADRAIKTFLMTHMYRHPRVMTVMGDAERVLADLFARYAGDPETLPAEWRHDLPDQDGARARLIADFIAGMTDRYALIEHRRLFDSTPQLR
jgi:dGTPase